MRICLIYDCLYPHTVGGAERWYRSVAERLVADGHEVTYLTLRQWDRGAEAGLDGVTVRTVGPRMSLYTSSGRRRILPPLMFGLGVLVHLLRHRRRYETVHTASFPYFSLLAAGLARRTGGYRLVVDWHEVWTLEYWREYLGVAAGTVGWLVQRICARIPQRAFCFSQLHARRLQSEGLRGNVVVLTGEYDGKHVGPLEVSEPDPLVLFVGRLIPEKCAPAVVEAIAHLRGSLPQIRGKIIGDGPERDAVRQAVIDHGLEEVVDLPGFVDADEVQAAFSRAMCLVLPSRREGYGQVVIEAAAHGTPSIIVAGADNAAVELLSDGENGFVAPSALAADLAAAVLRVRDGGSTLRDATAAWFDTHVERLSVSASLDVVSDAYGLVRSAAS